MYIIYNGEEQIVDINPSPVGARLKVIELHQNGDTDAFFVYDEGARR